MDLLDDYITFTNDLPLWAGTTHGMMHVHCGLALYLGMQVLLRTRRASPLALAVVVTVAIVHEAMQRLFYGVWRWEDTIGDIALTTMWPAAITLVGLYRRARWRVYEMRRLRSAAPTTLRPANTSQWSRKARAN